MDSKVRAEELDEEIIVEPNRLLKLIGRSNLTITLVENGHET